MASPWREVFTKEGRPYYHNTQTNATAWTKPAELDAGPQKPSMTPQAAAGQWKTATAGDGRTYYYHTATRETKWEMPEELKRAQAAPTTPATPVQSNGPSFVAGGAPNFQPPQRESHRLPDRPDRPDRSDRLDRTFERARDYGQTDGYRPGIVTGMDDMQFVSSEEAESNFAKLLKRVGVQPDWTWEQTMRATITDPQYRAIKDPKERRAAFEKYVIEVREQDKERAKERVERLREDFTSMLKNHPEIKHYTRWKSARPILEGEIVFRSSNDDTERKQLYEEYIAGLQKAHKEQEVANRKSALVELSSILRSLQLEPYSRWADARQAIEETEKFQNDDKFRSLTPSDVLTVFQDHVRDLERELHEKQQQRKNKKLRAERQHRDDFKALMRELRASGKLRAGTKWKDVHALIEKDPRYDALLGQSGSTPLDLFWDAVEDEEREYRAKRNEALDVLDDANVQITPQTTLDEVASVLKNDPRTASHDDADIELVYKRFHDKVVRREQEDKQNAERHTRHAIDRLRSVIKHLRPPISPDDSWEDVKARVEKYPEYQDLEGDEQRKSAFDKVLKRLKEREADDQAREREKAMRRAERDREDRYLRYAHHGEADAYEADRRKAQAARERQYRKAAGTGLSPPRHRDERYDRHYRHDRERERDRSGYYDLDREQHRGREQTYRAKLSDPSAELDYGDSGRAGSSINNTAGRRRRGSGDEDGDITRRDSKRLRRSSKTSGQSGEDDVEMKGLKEEAEKEAKEEENLKSGSEEGEIEEV
ncbi:MAG: hypothetical protein Q9159_004335 [Coniocarpon cinnabarinum]